MFVVTMAKSTEMIGCFAIKIFLSLFDVEKYKNLIKQVWLYKTFNFIFLMFLEIVSCFIL